MPKLEPTDLHPLGTCISFQCWLGSPPGDLIPRGSNPKEVLRCLFSLTSKMQSNYVRFPTSSKSQECWGGSPSPALAQDGQTELHEPHSCFSCSFHGFPLVGNCLCPIPTALLSVTPVVSLNTDVSRWVFYIVSMQITDHKCLSDFIL